MRVAPACEGSGNVRVSLLGGSPAMLPEEGELLRDGGAALAGIEGGA
jgi:hypothetical protein